ncbi:MAG: PAS domain-containing protein [Pseudomonadota bacterium]|jgi:PAS domain S-box-containing protein
MDTKLKDFLLSHALEGIVVTDMEGDIMACNQTACRLLGYQELELLAQFVGFIFPAKSVSHLLPNLLHLARETGRFDGDIILEDSLGEEIMVRMAAQAWPSADPTYILLRFLDWRETHQIMTLLKESSQMATLGILTRSLSHEIINPVSVIGGHTRRLLEDLPPDSREETWALQVLDNVEKLESMIETIGNFLNIPNPSFSKGSPEDLLRASVQNIEEEASRLGIMINLEMARKTPEIYLDPQLLEKAFSAVLLNALDRMPNGGQLNMSLDSETNYCRILIGDSGPSLDMKQMEEDLSPVHVMEGHRAHLNLAIAKRIVDEHGGRFEIGSMEPVGLRVRMRLPIDRRALAREREM